MASVARMWHPSGKQVDAKSVYSKIPFYCNNEGCTAKMIIVSLGNSSAHFRSFRRADHAYAECLRNDVIYDTDTYDNDKFVYDEFRDRIMRGTNSKREHGHFGGKGGKVGTGSRIPPMTLKAIYASYIDALSNQNTSIGDSEYKVFMRCKENYMDFVMNPEGFFVVETTFFHKVKDELAFILNVPMYKNGEKCFHVKVNFRDKADFWRVYKHYINTKPAYLNIMLVANEWKKVDNNSDYFAECTITKSSQHAYISCN